MKKQIRYLVIALAVFALFASACGNDASVTQGPDTPEPEPTATTERLWVGAQLVDCVGVAPQKCMQVRRAADGEIEWFYDTIEGFTHVAGTSYVLDVAVTPVDNPAADGSSRHYRLVEIIEQTVTSAADQVATTPWPLLGFRDGDLFDPVGDAEITIRFEGGQASGSAGCNSYFSDATIDGSSMSFGPIGATKMLCQPDVMAQETRFLSVLETVTTAEIGFDGMLVLATDAGLGLVFAPA